MVKIFSSHSVFSVLSDLAINLSSGWFGVVLIAPGISGSSSFTEYIQLLTINVPFGIVGLVIAMGLRNKE
ncbi:MAG: hypothetical protein Q7S14_01635 [bacterium]|nr:hypothetical protein [bacterium]